MSQPSAPPDAARQQGIGDEMNYIAPNGRLGTGIVINVLSARLVDIDTGEVYDGRKFYLWDQRIERGHWTCAIRAGQAGKSNRARRP